MNKKIIFVILLFIGISFIIYSFANPAGNSNELSNNNSNEEKENNNIIDKSDILDNDEDDEKNGDEDESDLSSEEENDGDEELTNPDLIVTTPINRPNNGGTYRPSTPSGGGSSSNKPNGGNNGNQSGGETNNPGDGTGNNKPGDNNGGNTGENKPQEPVTPPDEKPNPDPKPPVYSDFGLAQSGSDVENVKFSQSENNIVLSGSMTAQPITDKFNTGSYIKVQLVAPEAYTDEQLQNMTVTLSNGRVLTQAKDNLWNGTRTSNGRPSYVFTQQFKRGETYSFTISWDGQSSATYHISYNIKVNK